MRNFRLRMDVEDLQNAYRSALKGLHHREYEIENMVRAQLGMGPDDDWPDRNEDDPDDLVSLLYDHAGELDDQAKRGAPMVRKAFLIALFHAWERYCNARLKRERYDHDLAMRRILIRDGHAAQTASFRELQLAANCAKHGQGESCADLFHLRPIFFRTSSVKKADERTLVIEEETLTRFFRAVVSVSR
jgi:hypothetical protein